MSTLIRQFVYVIKNPGKRAESVTLGEGVNFMDEIYRVMESGEGNPPGRKGSMGDRPYPEQFGKPDLRFIFDDEFGYKPMQPNCWGVKGPILVARLEDDHYSSLDPDDIEGIIEDLEQEVRKAPNDWVQTLKSYGKYF